MTYIDFHTHNVSAMKDVIAVVDGRDTWGIHPWRAEETIVVPDFSSKLAIGECGLDGLRGPSMDRQEEVFMLQISLSEQTSKPLIIHCVKAFDRLLSLRKKQQPTMPWMFHGFRGKPQQLRSLLDAGCFVSFGFCHNEESLCICPIDRMLLETDVDSEHSIAELYNCVADKRGIDVSTLGNLMLENYRAFFQNEPLLKENAIDVC